MSAPACSACAPGAEQLTYVTASRLTRLRRLLHRMNYTPCDVKGKIPEHPTERVFVLGTLSEREDLKGDLGPYEVIGSSMAQDCREDTDKIWGHLLLRHNAGELARLREQVRPILF